MNSAALDPTVGNALRDRQALAGLVDHPGWKVMCGVFDAHMGRLTLRILDRKTAAAEAELLRQVRGLLADESSPRAIVGAELTRIDALVERENKKHPPQSQP